MSLLDQFKSLFSQKRPKTPNLIEDDDFPKGSPIQSSANSSLDEENLMDKTKEFISGTVEEVKQQGSALWNEVKEQAENIEESTREFRENLKQKAQDTVEKVEGFVDATLEKAKALEEQERMENPDKDGDGIADKPIDFGESAGKKHEDFFSKAETWLKDTEKMDATNSVENNTKRIEPLELPKDPEEPRVPPASN
ncbi:MAG: hypothetical protein IPM92_06045 [Saprospiraceae bacterium]|nr:hypothetical protein [Saprospiraceae bacterium]